MTQGPAPRDPAAILRARAKVLARREPAAEPGAAIELLELRLARESYALETRHVSEVLPLVDLTPVPCTPAFILGVVNIRGRITAVVDIRRFFGLPTRGMTDLHHIILVRGGDMEFGILADVVAGVRSQPRSGLQPAQPTLTAVPPEYLLGVTTERLVVLDVERVLADPRLIVQEEVNVMNSHDNQKRNAA